jgi:hypothetical protein
MEDGFVVADQELRDRIASSYPDLSRRFARRRTRLRDVFGIRTSEDLLSMSDLAGFYRPYLLESAKALVIA